MKFTRLKIWVAGLIAIGLIAAGCATPDFDTTRSIAQFEDALRQAGLQVCSIEDTGIDAPGAVASAVIEVSLPSENCAEDSRDQIRVDEFESQGARDAAITTFRIQGPPRNTTAFAVGNYAIFAGQSSDAQLVGDLDDAVKIFEAV